MKRGRKPTPTHLRLVRGNPGKRRMPTAEPAPAPDLPAPPPHLSEDARAEWERVAAELYQLGVLTKIDRAALAVYCQAYGRWAQAERALARIAARDEQTNGLMVKTTNGNAVQNPLVGTANKAMDVLLRAAAEFGMTPSARVRVSRHGEEADDGSLADKYFA